MATLIVHTSWNMSDLVQEEWKSLPNTWMTLVICMDWVSSHVHVYLYVCASMTTSFCYFLFGCLFVLNKHLRSDLQTSSNRVCLRG